MCASPAAEVESREKRVCGLTDRKAGNLDTYIEGVEGTILVAGRWAVPDRPPASWYGPVCPRVQPLTYMFLHSASRSISVIMLYRPAIT
jgi:hypothetical protein